MTGERSPRVALLALASALLLGLCPTAAAGPPVRLIPGLAGRALAIAGVVPLADGGAIVGATIDRRIGGHTVRSVAVARLRFDGAVDLAFGHWGVAVLDRQIGMASVTAVATDWKRGAVYLGVALGRRRAGAIVALDGRGQPLRGFGRHGILRLRGGAGDGGPTAIAMTRSRVFAATGSSPCLGCRMVALARRSGHELIHRTLGPVDRVDRCSTARVSTLVASDGRLVLGGSGGASCVTRLVLRTTGLHVPGRLRPGGALALRGGATRVSLAPAGGRLSTCLAVQDGRGLELARLSPAGLEGKRSSGDGRTDRGQLPTAVFPQGQRRRGFEPLGGLAAVGRRGCVALARYHRTPYLVASSVRRPNLTVRRIPPGLRPTGVFPCRGRLVVVGVRRVGRRTAAALFVVGRYQPATAAGDPGGELLQPTHAWWRRVR